MPNAPTTDPSIAFRTNSEIAIHVPDLDRAAAFYGGVLGFRLRSRTDDQLEFETGALRLYVNREAVVRSFIPSLDVADAAAARRRLEAEGCTIERIAADGSGFYVLDPFGLTLDVIQRPAR